MTLAQTHARWKYRRGIVFFTLLVCFSGIGYLTLWGTDTRLNETLAMGYFALAGATIGSYCFAATWDDTVLAGRPSRRPRRAEETPDDGTEP